jgi:hypothetical protein
MIDHSTSKSTRVNNIHLGFIVWNKIIDNSPKMLHNSTAKSTRAHNMHLEIMATKRFPVVVVLNEEQCGSLIAISTD